MSKVIELAHQQFGLQYINEMATKILANCDGTKSISMILVQVETNLNNDQSLKLTPTIGFVKEAIKRGYLECYDHPHPRKIHITGSSDYYTPIHMMLELTYNCNLKCKHCYNDSGLKKADNIPLNDYLKIIQELKNKGVRGVELTGGEPLCHPDFKSIFKECAESFETVAVLTNGYALDEKIAELIGEYKQKVIVQVDLDGSSAEVHDYIRGVHGSFEKAKSAIKYLAQRNIKTRAAMSVLPNSIFDIENTLLLAKELGARWFAFSPVQKIGRGTDMLFNFTDRDYLHMEEIKQTFISKYKDFVLVV
ncbi:MAG: radical SAM protein [Bacteroides sp.]|nr:radical SAM protein [Bacteroides sp.]